LPAVVDTIRHENLNNNCITINLTNKNDLDKKILIHDTQSNFGNMITHDIDLYSNKSKDQIENNTDSTIKYQTNQFYLRNKNNENNKFNKNYIIKDKDKKDNIIINFSSKTDKKESNNKMKYRLFDDNDSITINFQLEETNNNSSNITIQKDEIKEDLININKNNNTKYNNTEILNSNQINSSDSKSNDNNIKKKTQENTTYEEDNTSNKNQKNITNVIIIEQNQYPIPNNIISFTPSNIVETPLIQNPTFINNPIQNSIINLIPSNDVETPLIQNPTFINETPIETINLNDEKILNSTLFIKKFMNII